MQNQTVPLIQMVGGTTDVTLNIFRPGTEESGNYTCVATSILGTIQRTADVDIRCMQHFHLCLSVAILLF